jgi:hypothetical protein
MGIEGFDRNLIREAVISISLPSFSSKMCMTGRGTAVAATHTG